ncbi:MAG: class I SAM-dependent methyltransferase [Candidatus Freyarchaeota archaeon]|nr:class I SAM-dependent methyltransferase [Candidatus Jordarchaeia archaeon]
MSVRVGRETMRLWEEFVTPFLPKEHFLYRPYTEYTFRGIERGNEIIELFNYVKIPVGGKLTLDLGLGSGGISIAFSMRGARVVGIDIEKHYPRIACSWGRDNNVEIDAILASGANLPFKDEAFDLIVCNDVIEHVKDAKRCSEEISRALKRGGALYITCPNRIAPLIVARDGHYGLPLQSLMPKKLADAYVRAARRAVHDNVPYQPTFTGLVERFRKLGIELYSVELSMQFKSFHEPQNQKLVSKIKKTVAKYLPGVVEVYSKHFFLKWFTPLWRFIGVKKAR